MKKLFGIIVLWLLITNVSFADTVGFYKVGKGPLKVTKYIADSLEYYFSGGRIGKWGKKKNTWKPAFIVISSDGRHEYHYVMRSGQSSAMPNHYIGKARIECKKKSGKECFLFAKGTKIVWDNGSDKKRRRLKRKEIMNGQTLQILKELGFYGGSIAKTTTSSIDNENKKKAAKAAEKKRKEEEKKAERKRLQAEKKRLAEEKKAERKRLQAEKKRLAEEKKADTVK